MEDAVQAIISPGLSGDYIVLTNLFFALFFLGWAEVQGQALDLTEVISN